LGTPLGDHNRWGLRSLDTRPWECWISRSMVGLRVGRRAGLRVGPLLDSTKHHKRPPAPLYKSAWTRDLRQRVFARSRAISFGPADRHSYTATGLSGGHDCRKTPVLGGSLHQFWFWHPPSGPIASGNGVNALNSWAITFWPRRPGRWHRAEGPALWTPTDWFIIG
jgi:hypothetical protein